MKSVVHKNTSKAKSRESGLSTIWLIVIVVIAVLCLGGYWYVSNESKGNSMNTQSGTTSPTISNTTQNDDLDQNNSESLNQDQNSTDNTVSGTYIDFSESNLRDASANGGRTVLFFHANWCPTCKVANSELNANQSLIPEGVTVLKTDYDTESELKKKYAITTQHTFVQIDENGNKVAIWNGGGIDELRANLK